MDKDESNDPSYCNPSDKTTRILFSRQAQIFEHFQIRWRQEYLTSLREYHKTTGKMINPSRQETWCSSMMIFPEQSGRWQL